MLLFSQLAFIFVSYVISCYFLWTNSPILLYIVLKVILYLRFDLSDKGGFKCYKSAEIFNFK